MEVYVVTNVEAGWDCVCGVYSSLMGLKEFFADRMESISRLSEEELDKMSLDGLEEMVEGSAYIIHCETLHD
jgi:hypothetical protein